MLAGLRATQQEGEGHIDPINPAGVRFDDLPEQAWPRHEIIDGSPHVTPLVGVPHQIITTNLTVALAQLAPPDLRVLAGVNILRRRETDRLLIPDVAVVDRSAATAQRGASLRPEDVYLAVEVISPSSRAADLYLKKQLYTEWGIGSYWVLDQETQETHEFGLRDSATCWLSKVDLSGIWP
ncbi:MAG TPA: Uma2 family endonuclease [Kineosporiaceae bacterium]|nr:Uma2 family endonuclease [Kineosporiaceae bacterium]